MMHKLILMMLFGLSSVASAQTRELLDFTDLVEKQGAAVVNISTVQTQSTLTNRAFPGMPNIPEGDPFFEFFRRHMPPNTALREFESRSLGSGFIISTDGHILTNTHIIESADEITGRILG